jgi:transposase
MDATAELPDDPQALIAIIRRRDEQLAQREAALAQRDTLIAERESQLEQVKREAADQLEALRLRHQAELAALLRRLYGPRQERFDPTQLLLFGQLVDTMPLDEAGIAQEAGAPGSPATGDPATGSAPAPGGPRHRHRHGRGRLPEHLPRVRIEHDLPPEEKPCPCCGNARHRIGEEISEQLEYVPASFKVLQHVRPKYACRHCETHGTSTPVDIAAKPAEHRPIGKGLAGPGLLAHVITGKLGDHLPLYRLERIYARSGVDIARSTMCAWLDAAARIAAPLVELMAQRVRQSRVIHTDETRVPVQAPAPGTPGGKCRSGRIWTYIGDPRHPYIVYDHTPDRTRAGPSTWLANFRGHLQADAYGGYDGIYASGGVVEVACWAHARRKFFDAKETDGRRAAEMLGMVRELYAVEDEAKARIAGLAEDQGADAGRAGTAHADDRGGQVGAAHDALDQADAIRLALRQERSVPILAKIKAWLDAERRLVLPRSPMAGAIAYTLNQWDALNRYAGQGFLNIDNNAAERALKRIAIGRKNWLFAGNDHFGGVAATLHSLIASAERHGLDPQRYLTGVLARIGSTPKADLPRLLPDEWKRRDAEPATPHSSSPTT